MSEARRLLRLWAGLRIVYGTMSIVIPDVLARTWRPGADPDVRVINAFVGSRDLVIGLISLRAADRRGTREAVALNQANDVVDAVALAFEARRGRGVDFVMVTSVFANVFGHLCWWRARRALAAS